MKTIEALVLAGLVAASSSSVATAATITFEQPFSVSTDYEFEAFPGNPGLLDAHYFDVLTAWAVPVFDATLGTVEALFLDLNGVFSITGQLEPDTAAFVATWFTDPLTLSPTVFSGNALPCDRPCFDLFHVQEEWSFAYLQGDPQFIFPIGTHFDSHITYDVSSAGQFHVDFTGTASATYLYTPADTAIPEPTSLILIGTGLCGSGEEEAEKAAAAFSANHIARDARSSIVRVSKTPRYISLTCRS